MIDMSEHSRREAEIVRQYWAKRHKAKIIDADLQCAVSELTDKDELWRSAWSTDPTSDAFHRPLRRANTGHLMAWSGNQSYSHWDVCSMTVEDILAKDWEVRRVKR